MGTFSFEKVAMELESLSNSSSEVVINEWDQEKKEFCKQLANRRGAYVWLYSSTAKNYTMLGRIFIFCAAIFTGIVGIVGVIINGVPSLQTIWEAALALSVLTVVSGLTSTIYGIIGFEDRAKDHSKAAGKSSKLFLDIRKEIKKDPEKRMPANKFIGKILEDDIELKNELLHIPRRIVRKYYRTFGDRAIPYNLLFSEDTLLHIEEDDEESEPSEIVDRAMRGIASVGGIHAIGSLRKMKEDKDNPADPTVQTEEELEQCIQNHESNVKRRRAPPELSMKEMADLERYLASE